MSRAKDITLFLICIQAAIPFINGLGVFTAIYSANPVNPASEYSLMNLSDYTGTATQSTSAWDEAYIMVHWVMDGFSFMVNVFLNVVFVWLTLVTVFHVPVLLSTFLQAAVWLVYASYIAQWISNKPEKLYE